MFHRPAETIWTKKNQDVRARLFDDALRPSHANWHCRFQKKMRQMLFNTKTVKESILIRVLIQIRSFSLQNWQMRRFELLATRPRSCSRQNGRLFGLPDSSVVAAVNFALCVEDSTPVALLELQLRIDVDLDLWLTEGMISNEMI